MQKQQTLNHYSNHTSKDNTTRLSSKIHKANHSIHKILMENSMIVSCLTKDLYNKNIFKESLNFNGVSVVHACKISTIFTKFGLVVFVVG